MFIWQLDFFASDGDFHLELHPTLEPFFCISGNLPSFAAEFPPYKFPSSTYYKVEYIYDSPNKTLTLSVDGTLIGTHTYTTAHPMLIRNGHFGACKDGCALGSTIRYFYGKLKSFKITDISDSANP